LFGQVHTLLRVIYNLSTREVRVFSAKKKQFPRSAQVDGGDQQSRELEKSERLLAQESIPKQ
jgi:hypothetical protein